VVITSADQRTHAHTTVH